MTRDSDTYDLPFGGGVDEIEKSFLRVTSLAESFGRTIVRSFTQAIVTGKGFADTLRGLALQLSQIVLKAAFKPLESIISGFAAGFLPGFAKGGVFDRGLPVPFAKGGVVASPTTFPLPLGRTGLMGEAGPEAIMPLTRGPDGRLGVSLADGGGRAVTVNFNVSTPDVDGFRRSEAQLSALLARAVARGQRNF